MEEKHLHESEGPSASEQYKQLWRMRWFFAGCLCTYTFTSAITPIIAFCFTRSLLCLSFVALNSPWVAFLWHRFAKYLLPLSENEYQLALAKRKRRFSGEESVLTQQSPVRKDRSSRL